MALDKLMGMKFDSVVATGGTVTYSGGYKIHTFTTNGTFTVTTGGNVEYLVVAGGGGGGGITNNYGGGGGGAGGYLAGTGHAVTPQAYGITVGNGGPIDTSGNNSVFDTKTAIAGGKGGKFGSSYGVDGGSGGGSAGNNGVPTAGLGTVGPPRQGYDGGLGGYPSVSSGGGGGGSSAVGSAAADGSSSGANGGAGTSNSISGSPVTYATGGRGGDKNTNAGGSTGGANTGDGGGAGLSGGSGIVIIRYPF